MDFLYKFKKCRKINLGELIIHNRTNQWFDFLLPLERRRHGMVNIKDVIYVVGGINQTGVLDTVETYDVETDMWTKLDTTLPQPTYKACTIGKLTLLTL